MYAGARLLACVCVCVSDVVSVEIVALRGGACGGGPGFSLTGSGQHGTWRASPGSSKFLTSFYLDSFFT